MLEIVSIQLRQDFELASTNQTDIRKLLTQKIEELLQHDLSKLMNILYRIDVSEEKVKTAFQQQEFFQIAAQLSDLVIQRQQQKMKYRK